MGLMVRLSSKIVIQALQAFEPATAWQIGGTCALPCQQSMRGISSSLQRSLVLPKLLDIHSDQYQQSSQRMSGLLSDMASELEKVCTAGKYSVVCCSPGWFSAWLSHALAQQKFLIAAMVPAIIQIH
jgi:hypothetical protein